jgi:hypothetical protein
LVRWDRRRWRAETGESVQVFDFPGWSEGVSMEEDGLYTDEVCGVYDFFVVQTNSLAVSLKHNNFFIFYLKKKKKKKKKKKLKLKLKITG